MPFSLSSTVPAPWCRNAALVAMALGLGGCANFDGIGPKARITEPQALGLGSTAGQAASTVAAVPAVAKPTWWTRFGDAQLDALVQQALQNHPNLRIAQARVARAQALTDSVAGTELPNVNGAVDATRQRYSANGIYPPPLAGGVYETANAQINAGYEFDLFGKNRAALDAALGQVRAAQADAQAAELLLATQVTRSYFTLLRVNALQALAQRNLAQREQLLALVQSRLSAGLDSPTELRSSEASLPEIRQYAESLREQAASARNALAALTGQPLGLQDLKAGTLAQIKPQAAPQTVPLDLLANRPDVAAARARVEAALNDVEVAKAQFYPNINLVAFAGFNSIGFGNISKAGSEQWGVGPAVRLPIFDGGRLRAQLKGRAADVDVAIESYNALVIDAVREVADQVTALQSIARQGQEQKAGLAAAQTLQDIAAQRFAAGLSSRASVLNAQSTVLAQDRQAIELAARTLDVQALLLRATGGSVAVP